MVQMFVRTVVRMRVIVSYSVLFISISLNIFCPYFSILLDFIFSCATQTLFCFIYPLPMFQHADRPALFQRFSVVCFPNLITPDWMCIVTTNNRLGSQPSKVSAISTPRHLQPAVATGR